jgi:hypothetical protein
VKDRLGGSKPIPLRARTALTVPLPANDTRFSPIWQEKIVSFLLFCEKQRKTKIFWSFTLFCGSVVHIL